MKTAMISMPREVARDKLKAYRKKCHKDSEELYSEAIKGFEALAEGTPLIKLNESIVMGGFDDKMRPRLAIARADRREVMFRRNWNSSEGIYHCGSNHSIDFPSLIRRVTFDTQKNDPITAYALVPFVPADVRPAVGQLKDWFILWEVDRWYSSPRHMKAPTDPMLLKHIGGDLYAVLAQWDLTPLEQAILEARPR